MSVNRISAFPQLFPRQPVFSGLTQIHPCLHPYRHVLQRFVEHGRPLTLPRQEQIPSFIRNDFSAACTHLTPRDLQKLHQQGAFGVAEEMSDIVYYLITKSALEAQVFTKDRFEAFSQSDPIKHLQRRFTPKAYERMIQQAQSEISTQDIQAIRRYFPLPFGSRPEDLMKRFLAMVMVDYVVQCHAKRSNSDLSDPKAINNKIREEVEEYAERVPSLAFEQERIANNLCTSPNSSHRWLPHLVRLGQRTLNTPDFTLENLMQFQLFKSSGRTEYLFCHPHTPYVEAKPHCKAWEKIFEADLFLKPLL